MLSSDISDFRETSDWWFILFAILFIDLVVILLGRHFPGTFGKELNEWYDKFGLSAVIADVLIIAIGFVIARYAYSNFFAASLGWSPLYFITLLVLIQVLHDFLFYVGVILPIPRGFNAMMDVFKDYSKGGLKIIISDALMMVGSALVAMWLKSQPDHILASFGLLTAYAVPYALYTDSGL
jgi:hypothetical protein